MRSVKLLLTTNVANLGIVGDVVSVKPGYARNYLIPSGIATNPTPGNVQRLAEKRKQVEQEMRQHRANLEALLERLQDCEITIMRSANEQGVLFGGVSQQDIAQTLQDEGYAVDNRAVRIGEQIKQLDSYQIPIELESDLKVDIKLWVISDKPVDKPEDESQVEAEVDQNAAQSLPQSAETEQ